MCLTVRLRIPLTFGRVLEATLLLEADLDLPTLLHHIIDEARSMTNARYGALGVLNEDGSTLSDFLTVGLDPEQVERIGDLPTGRGVLGTLISDPKPLRLTRLDSHTDSYGFPPNHPPMNSFLGVPIMVRDEIYGNLYLTDKIGWSEFTSDDEALIGALGRHRRHRHRERSASRPSPGIGRLRGAGPAGP